MYNRHSENGFTDPRIARKKPANKAKPHRVFATSKRHIHCQRGADRTGMLCAMYRVVVCDWPRQDAIEEMMEGGFRFNPMWRNLVRYIERADIDELRRRAGLPPYEKHNVEPLKR